MKLLIFEADGVDMLVMFVPDDYDKKKLIKEVRQETDLGQSARILEEVQLPPSIDTTDFPKNRYFLG